MPIDLASNKGSSKTSKICFLLEWISKKGGTFALGQSLAKRQPIRTI